MDICVDKDDEEWSRDCNNKLSFTLLEHCTLVPYFIMALC